MKPPSKAQQAMLEQLNITADLFLAAMVQFEKTHEVASQFQHREYLQTHWDYERAVLALFGYCTAEHLIDWTEFDTDPRKPTKRSIEAGDSVAIYAFHRYVLPRLMRGDSLHKLSIDQAMLDRRLLGERFTEAE
jgi:hypothetical protein